MRPLGAVNRRGGERQQPADVPQSSPTGRRRMRLVAPRCVFASVRRAFAAFEASAAVDLVADGLPWPPDDCPVSGVRRTDSDAARKQRLKKAMLRWHPDKFLATNGTRIRPDELPAVTERLGAVLQRVQQERHAYGCATGVE